MVAESHCFLEPQVGRGSSVGIMGVSYTLVRRFPIVPDGRREDGRLPRPH